MIPDLHAQCTVITAYNNHNSDADLRFAIEPETSGTIVHDNQIVGRYNRGVLRKLKLKNNADEMRVQYVCMLKLVADVWRLSNKNPGKDSKIACSSLKKWI